MMKRKAKSVTIDIFNYYNDMPTGRINIFRYEDNRFGYVASNSYKLNSRNLARARKMQDMLLTKGSA